MDIEWGKDGSDGKIYILQARPETVNSQKSNKQIRYQLKEQGIILTSGRAVGQKAATGIVKVIHDHTEMNKIQDGDVLVTDMTDPDWEPIMKRAAAIVTNRGGRTCHAAIIARELGVPAIVGCGNATEILKDGMIVRTKGENIEKVRREILELELINHPIDCPTCDQAGECKLQMWQMEKVH